MKLKSLQLIIMLSKLSLYGVFVQCLFITVLLASEGNAQKSKSINDVYLTVGFEASSLLDVFHTIETETSFEFSYYKKDLPKATLSLDKSERSLSETLYVIAEQAGLRFRRVNDNIFVDINKKPNKRTGRSILVIEDVDVFGKITDETDQGLPGASVVIKGTSIGTTTDIEGNYKLTVPDDAILSISYVGYITQDVEIAGRSEINVSMAADVSQLDELVVIGYGVQKKVNVTGSVDVIAGDILENRQSPTVSQLLQGVSPGLTFSIGNNGFSPGASVDIGLRGTGSINGGDGPYVVIDGIPGDMNRLNPNDIESISVLKDAAASAIYGARAPYGVILITTKSGSTDENISVTYSGIVSRATPQNLPSMLNSYDHARALNEAGVAGAGGRFIDNTTIDNIRAYQAGDYDFIKNTANFPADATHFETTPRAGGNSWGFNQFGNSNRDWFDEYYGSALNKKHNLSLQGGSKTTSFYFSTGFFEQEGVLNYGTDTFDRFNIQGKVKTAITDWWDFTYQPRFSKTKRELPNMDRQGSYDLIFHQIARTMPTNAKYDGYGNIMIQSKIPWVNDAGTDIIDITENWQTFSTDLRPVKGLNIHSDFAFRVTDQFRSNRELTVYDHLVDQSIVASGNTVPSNITNIHQSNTYWTTNNYISYDYSLNDAHNFKLLVGTQFERANNRNMSATRLNLLVQDVPSLLTASGDPTISEGLHTWATQGYFGRFTYNYKGKYLLESNVRYDGTSRFKEGKRWGFFPSFSLGWNLHEENFWESIESVVNTLKIRGSWGELGNFGDPNSLAKSAFFPDILLIPLSSGTVNWIFSPGQGRPIGYAGTPGLINPDVTWETARTINLGLNMSFLQNRLQADFDVFERTTFDQLGKVEAQPGVIGTTLPQANNVTLRSKGWELSLRWQQRINDGLSYNIGVNFYDNKSTIVDYLNPTGTLSDHYEGKVLGEIWGYTANDLYRTQQEVDEYTSTVDLSDLTGLSWNTGDVKYEDTNGDGMVNNGANTVTDHGDRSIIGNTTPRLQYGITASLNYKGFDFSMLWKGVAKRDLWFGSGDNIFWGFRTGNQSSLFPHHLDYFRDTPGDEYTGIVEGDANFNTGAYFPRPYLNNGQNNKNRISNTRYLQSGAYIRLQNVQLGYNLPKDVLSKLSLQRVRLYVSGENLFTFSGLPVGIDPVAVSSSWGTGKTYGADRIVSLGLTVTY